MDSTGRLWHLWTGRDPESAPSVTNTLAIVLGLAILGAIVGDVTLWDGQHLTFLGRKGLDLLEWMAFWR